MDIGKIIGTPVDGVIPEEIMPFIALLMDGRVRQMAITCETVDGGIADCFLVIDPETANVYTMVGAIESLKRDYMRAKMQPRIQYKEDDE